MEKNFEFKDRELKRSKIWEEKSIFNQKQNLEKKAMFSVALPPPNVTGQLHMGHALNSTLQDISIRYKAMSGFNTLWIPGTDHAGIATQNVVEKQLEQTQSVSAKNLSRNELISHIWEWKNKHGTRISQQLQRLGGALNWEHERFTLDANYEYAVRYHFVSLYNKGLIYKGHRITNWCPKNKTAISDIEVDYKEQEGYLYHIHYPLTPGEKDGITIATTRPETLFGDLAIAVHPLDTRYKSFIGQQLLIPVENRRIPVIADEAVEPNFGTGAVKVTPAHDPLDFDIGSRHKLGFKVIFDDIANMIDVPADYLGLNRFECRKVLLLTLENNKYLERKETIKHAVGYSSRSGDVIEPLLTEQWFINMKKLAKPAINAVENESIRFIPSRWKKSYLDWMYNIQDWCISRQIVWGHRIPVWYRNNELYCGLEAPDDEGWEQETDVLDTWFSSALWPFATLGWPKKTNQLKSFYPTSCLFTGYDIITFWVSRMITMGIEQMEQIPFSNVYIHGLVRDETGKKMSKSLGNAINPLDVIEEFGTDALRLSLARSATLGGQDIPFGPDMVRASRNFGNKIWNVSRYFLMCLENYEGPKIDPFKCPISKEPSDIWIISQSQTVILEISKALEAFNYAKAADLLWHFCWDHVCDWYAEFTKFRKVDACPVFAYVVVIALRLSHPFMPFISDEIFDQLKRSNSLNGFEDFDSWFQTPWPKVNQTAIQTEKDTQFQQLLVLIRDIRDALKDSSRPSELFLYGSKNSQNIFKEFETLIKHSLKVKTLTWLKQPFTEPSLSGISGQVEFFIPISTQQLEVKQQKLQKKKQSLEKELAKYSLKLTNAAFLEKAPSHVINDIKQKSSDTQKRLDAILNQLNG